jgi:predicted nuclease of predicted toxin-antitoxin system
LKFLIDAMLPPSTVELLDALGHDATTPSQLGAHNLPDEVLVRLASADGRVIVTENAADFAAVTDCPVLFVRKSWWSTGALASNLASALNQWAEANPEPGPWSHWLPSNLR